MTGIMRSFASCRYFCRLIYIRMIISHVYRASQVLHFRQWSRKSFAVFASLGRIIRIGAVRVAVAERSSVTAGCILPAPGTAGTSSGDGEETALSEDIPDSASCSPALPVGALVALLAGDCSHRQPYDSACALRSDSGGSPVIRALLIYLFRGAIGPVQVRHHSRLQLTPFPNDR
jgi:hypothetical protein